MKSSHSRYAGFTLIEMIVATAIGVMLVTGVYSATQSMTRAARTQADASKKDAPLRKTEEIIRNDLRGWIENVATGMSAAAEETAVLSFRTTADGFFPANGILARCSVSVHYVVRPVLGQFEVFRFEGSAALPLLRTNTALTVEFYDGMDWMKTWTRKERPRAIRLGIDERALVFQL